MAVGEQEACLPAAQTRRKTANDMMSIDLVFSTLSHPVSSLNTTIHNDGGEIKAGDLEGFPPGVFQDRDTNPALNSCVFLHMDNS